MNKRNLLPLIALVSSILFYASNANAQATAFQLERFDVMPNQHTNLLNTSKSDVMSHLTPSVGLFFHFQDDPLQISDGENTFRLVDERLVGELSLALGLFDFADIGVVIPTVLYQTGESLDGTAFEGGVDGFSLSDIRIVPKARFLDPEIAMGFGGAFMVPVYLPTGDSETFSTDDSVRVEPKLALDWRHSSGFLIATNFGFQFRKTQEAENYTSGNEIRWNAGAEMPVFTDIVAGGNIFGGYGIEDGRAPGDLGEVADNTKGRPIEAQGVLKFFLPSDLLLQVGGGAGLTDGVGTPDFRVFAGLEWMPVDRDADDDGINDEDDKCPAEPEDKDDFEDTDGCPDEDNDNDNIKDADDECPNDPEDVDTFEDDNGCPDPDNDQDGVLDGDDKCPLEAGAADNNGCPWGDSDGDGLLDNEDKCPQDPEDKDGFQDEDGCSDPDNDSDGILDADDKCPLEPETINGVEDEDGCPDKGESKVKVTKDKIEILDKVYFDTSKATIKKRSFSILNQVASVLKANPQIKLLDVEGHTDSRGKDDANMDLSQRRAESVKKYLTDRGIEADRLNPVGYGETKPIDDNKKRKGRDNNRRVEFNIKKVE